MPPPAALTPLSVWRWLWVEERIGLPLCIGVGLFFTLVLRGGLVENLVYSLAIGQIIQFSIEAGRYGFSHLLQRRRGGPPVDDRAWPGWGFMAPWILLCAMGGYWSGMHLGDLIMGTHHASHLSNGDMRMILPISIVTVTVSIGTTWFFHSQGRLETARAEAEAAKRVAAENQLRLLQSQLEPHMLFNTLANLRVLIGVDPARAQAMLDQLVGFLRSTLQASRVAQHPLRDEFARVSDYLALMKIRMGARLQPSLDLPEALADVQVPPLLLQPLVENAIKHGLEPQRDGGRLDLKARVKGTVLVITVRDTGGGVSAATGSDDGARFGLAQVRARLQTVYGSEASLDLDNAGDIDGGCIVTLRLPLAA